MTWQATDPKPGDIVRIELSMGLYHYGIYVSDEEVIAFGLPPIGGFTTPSDEIKVLATDIGKFYCGRFLEVGKLGFFEKLKARKPKDVVAYARSKIGDGGYDIIKNNCEHFVNECVFGVKKSAQADAAAVAVKNLTVANVYIARISDGDDFAAPLFPPERMSEIRSCANEKVKRQKYAVWKLLCFALNDALSVDINKTDIHKDKSGKWLCSDCCFSMSHTDGLVAVAVCKSPIGVDTERLDRDVKPEVFRNIMNKSEAKIYSDTVDKCEMIKLWTKKECVFKRLCESTFDPRKIDTLTEPIKTFSIDKFGVALSVSFDGARTALFEVTDGFTARKKLDATAQK